MQIEIYSSKISGNESRVMKQMVKELPRISESPLFPKQVHTKGVSSAPSKLFKSPLDQLLEVDDQNFIHKPKEKVTKDDDLLERIEDRVHGLSGCNLNTSEDLSEEGQESQSKQIIGLVKCDSSSMHKQAAPGFDVTDLLDKDSKSKGIVLDVIELVSGVKDKVVSLANKDKDGGEAMLNLNKVSMALGENASRADVGKELQQPFEGGKDYAPRDESCGEGCVIPDVVLVDELQSACVPQNLVDNVGSKSVVLATNAVEDCLVASFMEEVPGDNHPSEMGDEDKDAGSDGSPIAMMSNITEAQRIPDTRYISRV
jgi:hypothetical protein